MYVNCTNHTRYIVARDAKGIYPCVCESYMTTRSVLGVYRYADLIWLHEAFWEYTRMRILYGYT